jgi:hypothetical protein
VTATVDPWTADLLRYWNRRGASDTLTSPAPGHMVQRCDRLSAMRTVAAAHRAGLSGLSCLLRLGPNTSGAMATLCRQRARDPLGRFVAHTGRPRATLCQHEASCVRNHRTLRRTRHRLTENSRRTRTLKLTWPSVAPLLRDQAAERQSFGRQRRHHDVALTLRWPVQDRLARLLPESEAEFR